MEIGPIREGKPALSEQVKQEKPGESAKAAGKQSDDVEISEEAQRYLATEGDRTEENKIRHQGRLDQVRERIDTGYYDQDIVRDMTVEKMIDAMLEDINSFYG